MVNGDINELIIEKLKVYPEKVQELAIRAIRLSESSNSEKAVAEQLMTLVRKLASQPEGDGQ